MKARHKTTRRPQAIEPEAAPPIRKAVAPKRTRKHVGDVAGESPRTRADRKPRARAAGGPVSTHSTTPEADQFRREQHENNRRKGLVP